MRFTIRRIAAAILVIFLSFFALILSGQSAAADSTTDPGGGAVYGLDANSAATQDGYGAITSPFPDRGGYSRDPFFATSNNYTAAPGAAVSIGSIRLSEPVRLLTGDYPASVWAVYDQTTEETCNLAYCTGANGIVGASAAPGPVNQVILQCAASQWSMVADQHSVSSVSSVKVTPGPTSHEIVGGGLLTFSNSAATSAGNCPFLVSMTYWVDIRTTQSPNDPYQAADHVLTKMTWTARPAGNEQIYKKYSPAAVACNGSGVDPTLTPDCQNVVVNVNVAKLCDNPPQPAWSDDNAVNAATFFIKEWNNVGPTTQFYAKCLFYPAGGFDRFGDVSTAWGIGPFGKTLGYINGTVSSLTITGGSCGPITPSGTGAWRTFSIDTCAWPVVATHPMKTLIGIGLVLLTGWFLLAQVISITLGVINKKIPAPIPTPKDS